MCSYLGSTRPLVVIRCYKCNRKLSDGISGSDYYIEFTCPKCKCKFAVTPIETKPISVGKI